MLDRFECSKLTEHVRAGVEIEFSSGSALCRGVYLVGDGAEDPSACVVMAHGLGLTIDCGLLEFAEVFAKAGYSVLAFDYRCFGRSEGTPRQLVSNGQQKEDWVHAIEYARSLPEVDPNKIVTWGFSLGGGHAIAVAGEDEHVAAAIGVAPMLSGLSSTVAAVSGWSVSHALKIVTFGIVDVVRRFFGGKPVYVPVAASPGEFGIVTSANTRSGFEKIASSDFDFGLCARIVLFFWQYAPWRRLKLFGTRPALLILFSDDKVNPTQPSKRHALRCKTAEVVEMDCEHMDGCWEPHRSRVAEESVRFLARTFGD